MAARTPLKEVNARLRDAKRARAEADKVVQRIEKEKERIKNGPQDLDPHVQAGKKNVELMRAVFRKGGTLTAARATERAGSKPGHQVWAIRALVAEGQIEATGNVVGVSREYRFVRRRRTRLGPGE